MRSHDIAVSTNWTRLACTARQIPKLSFWAAQCNNCLKQTTNCITSIYYITIAKT